MIYVHPGQQTMLDKAIPVAVYKSNGTYLLDAIGSELFGQGTITTKVNYGWDDGCFKYEIKFLKEQPSMEYGKVIWEITLTPGKTTYTKHSKLPPQPMWMGKLPVWGF